MKMSLKSDNKYLKTLGKISPILILLVVIILLHLFGVLSWNRDQAAIEVGLINSLVVLALFLSYTMLNICDLSTDGCYTLGVAVGGVMAASGHPYLAIPAALLAGALSGLVTAVLQTKMGVNSLLSGIIVNTGLYSVNIVIMGKSTINIFRNETVFSIVRRVFGEKARMGFENAFEIMPKSPLVQYSALIVAGAFVIIVITFLSFFLRTKLGLAIHATGDNPEMVRSSSINPVMTIITGLCISGSMTALSGCLFIQYTNSADINVGGGMVTMALASLLIGGVFISEGSIAVRCLGAVLGTIIFRLIYAIALALKIDTNLLKLVYSLIVVIAISTPYFKKQLPMIKRRLKHRNGGEVRG